MLADGSHLGWQVAGGSIRYNSERGPPKDHSIKSLIPFGQAVSEIFNIFPIGSIFLKLCPLMSAILVGRMGSSA